MFEEVIINFSLEKKVAKILRFLKNSNELFLGLL